MKPRATVPCQNHLELSVKRERRCGSALGALPCLVPAQAQRKPWEPSATPLGTLSLTTPRSHGLVRNLRPPSACLPPGLTGDKLSMGPGEAQRLSAGTEIQLLVPTLLLTLGGLTPLPPVCEVRLPSALLKIQRDCCLHTGV